MTAPLLFCTAEAAKPFTRTVMGVKLTGNDESLFNLVETRAGPDPVTQEFKRGLSADEDFETEFIGASEQDCQTWALEMQDRHNFIEHDLIAIADGRSAEDGTLLMQFYSREPGLEIADKGVFPLENDTWHSFRIDPQMAGDVYASFCFGDAEMIYPVYFGRKEELTDEHGVLDVARAERICGGEES